MISLLRKQLSWKLALSHFAVTLISQMINLVGVALILVAAGQGGTSEPSAENAAGIALSFTLFFGTLFLIVSAFSSSIAATIGVYLANTFGKRLQTLMHATERMARGDLSVRVAVQDPDEIGQLAMRFNALTVQLAEATHARRQFVSTISHELRTPLAIIRAHIESHLGKEGAPPLPREALEAIHHETQALGHLIEDLFTLTQVDEAKLPIQSQPVAVQEIAATVVNGIRPLARRQGHIEVHSIIPAELPLAHTDPIRLAQILNNLLYNALRHTPEGGVIVIEGRLGQEEKWLELSVIDTGVGISDADLPYIFERFYRGAGGETREGGGLGLAIVKALVEAQGGTIDAESNAGQGTTIRFTLPRAP